MNSSARWLPSARDAGDADAAKLALGELLFGGLDGDAGWVELARSVVHELSLADGLAELDLRAVKPHILRANVGHPHPKCQADLGLVDPHGHLPRPGAAALGGDDSHDPSFVGRSRREPAHLLRAAGTEAQRRAVFAAPNRLGGESGGPEGRIASFADLGQREVDRLVDSLEALLGDPPSERALSGQRRLHPDDQPRSLGVRLPPQVATGQGVGIARDLARMLRIGDAIRAALLLIAAPGRQGRSDCEAEDATAHPRKPHEEGLPDLVARSTLPVRPSTGWLPVESRPL